MRLILVRHGQTSSNVAGLLDTDEPGAGLTGLGLEQAAALPGVLGAEPIEVLYASTLLRTQQTVAPLASFLGLEIRIRDGLREVRAGSLEMLGDEASVQTYLTTSFAWSSGDLHARMPGAESGAEVFARYDAVVAEIAASGAGTAAIVSHGSVIRTWTAARAENVTADFAARNALANTGAVVLEGSPSAGWRALTWEGRAVHRVEA
ncbi:histidine phosphatase family protein [Cellulomonas sp. WB94]|uniref:histidine phosphatase family protein n=1 Tax=Cellulomonas sp. WB94 TaxID=2173174 RepID=UPI000D583F72|nr:histidine phosphatase family protein [Cellulomonas sp. WB94]PVU82660.1 histidine phosphatase family protein [Cellulomonas sp. WB94]